MGKVIEKDSRHIVLMKRPASMYCHRWRDATPIGTGRTGVLFYGGTSAEHLVINRSDLWYHGDDAPVPDVSYCLDRMRELQKQGKYMEAHDIMYNELVSKNYGTVLADMRALGVVKVVFSNQNIYKNYKREISMDTSEARVSYKLEECAFSRKYLASRKRDIIAMDVVGDEPLSLKLISGFYETKEPAREAELKRNDAENAKYTTKDGCYIYSSVNMGKYFGIVSRVVSDGEVNVTENGIEVKDAKHALILVKAFSEEDKRVEAEEKALKELLSCPDDYEEIFSENLPLYEQLYNSADLKLSDCESVFSNERLISEAKEEKLTAILAEKLWRFARYLFISGTDTDALPFPLYGIWASGYGRNFTHHVANENVQSIYWHTDVGGLSRLDRALINYYCDNMDSYRENARKLFGCRGIFVGTYTTPRNKKVAWYVPVILHFNGVAGWLSEHFYRYYKYSGDEKLFEEKILPFMIEAASFYEDFYYLDENGKFTLYPAVSPENSPIEFYDKSKGHPMPVVENPTVEIAILKELLNNLIKESEKREELKEKAEDWKKLLEILPDYLINSEGAIAEWITENVHDTYDHRHISHLYPVFPGTEIEDTKRYELIKAFKKAIDLREVGSFCGWSMPHMASVYARLNAPEKAFSMLNGLVKVCLLDNFFTLGFDYRDMGITGYDCGNEFSADVQLDALMGFNNAIQEMIVFVSEKTVKLLPACPKEFGKGSARFKIYTGELELKWDIEKEECHGKITASRKTKTTLVLPFAESKVISLEKGEYFEF